MRLITSPNKLYSSYRTLSPIESPTQPAHEHLQATWSISPVAPVSTSQRSIKVSIHPRSQYPRKETYPKPSHHLHKAKRKNNPSPNPPQTLHPLKQPSIPPLINKKRNPTIKTEPTSRNAHPHIPIHRQRLGDVFRQTGENLEIFGGEVAVSQWADVAEGFV